MILKLCPPMNPACCLLILSPVPRFLSHPLFFPQTLALHNAWEGLWFGDRRASPWKDSQVSLQACWGMMMGYGEGSEQEAQPHCFCPSSLCSSGLQWGQRDSHWHRCSIKAQVTMGISFPLVCHLDIQTQILQLEETLLILSWFKNIL